jgi:hypothetical protein
MLRELAGNNEPPGMNGMVAPCSKPSSYFNLLNTIDLLVSIHNTHSGILSYFELRASWM